VIKSEIFAGQKLRKMSQEGDSFLKGEGSGI
jgi:hypothetical protein